MSGAEALRERLREHARVGLDTSIFIYHLEAHPRYLPLTTVFVTHDRRLSRLADRLVVVQLDEFLSE